LNKKKRE